MCIAIHKPAGKIIPDQILRNCFDNNSDGAGFAFAEGGKVTLHKGYFDFEEFLAALKPHAERELIIHFRIATHGNVNEFNCHPWHIPAPVDRTNYAQHEWAVIHNGILDFPSTPEKSDTGHFVDLILAPHLQRDPCFPFTGEGKFFLERAIGMANKLVILRSDGRVSVINEKAGVREDGVWYSNQSFRIQRLGSAYSGRGFRYLGWPDDDEDFESRFSRAADAAVAASSGVTPFPQESRFDPSKKADLRHLPKSKRKRLRKAARRYCEVYEPKLADEVEQIAALREECRFQFGALDTKDISDEKLDVMILEAGVLDTILTGLDEELAEMEAEQEEIAREEEEAARREALGEESEAEAERAAIQREME